MPRIMSRLRVTHSKFGKLPMGAEYWPASTGTAAAPTIKARTAGSNGGWNTTTGKLTVTAVSPTVEVIRVPPVFSKQNRLH